jgi:hypothetical protein
MQPRSNSGLRHIQATVPEDIHRRLRELAYEQHRPLADLLLDATILLLRSHGMGDGLPEPLAPVSITADPTSSSERLKTRDPLAFVEPSARSNTPKTVAPTVNTPHSTIASVAADGSDLKDVLALIDPGPEMAADESNTDPEDDPSTSTTTTRSTR